MNGNHVSQSPLNSNSIDHELAKQLKIDKLSLGSTPKPTSRRSHRHKHESKRKRRKKKKSHDSTYSDSDSELSKGKVKDKIKKISIRVPGDPNSIYKHWKRTKSHLKSTLLKTRSQSSPHLNIFNEEEEDDLNYNVDLNDTSSMHSRHVRHGRKLSNMATNPLYSYGQQINYHDQQRNINKKHHRNVNKGIKDIAHIEHVNKQMNDTQNRLKRERLNSYPPPIQIQFKSPRARHHHSEHVLSSPSSSMSNNSVIPTIKKSQSCSNLFDDEQYRKVGRNNIKLDELLTNKAIIIHTPKKTNNASYSNSNDHYNDSLSFPNPSTSAFNQHHYHYNYNFKVLGLKSYQNKMGKKEGQDTDNTDNENEIETELSVS